MKAAALVLLAAAGIWASGFPVVRWHRPGAAPTRDPKGLAEIRALRRTGYASGTAVCAPVGPGWRCTVRSGRRTLVIVDP